jgi:outer membrane protein assembly factor BamB
MSSPALLGDSIYFGGNNPYDFYSVNLTEHQISWVTNTTATGGLDDCSPAIWGNTVISGYTLTTSDGLIEPVLFAMNITNGNVLWQLNETAGTVTITPIQASSCYFGIQVPPKTVWNGIVYSDSTESGTLSAVNASSGALIWTFKTGPETANVNVFDGNLWMVNNAGTLFVLTPAGALLTETSVGEGVGPGNLIFAGQNVIIYGGNGEVTSMPANEIYPDK